MTTQPRLPARAAPIPPGTAPTYYAIRKEGTRIIELAIYRSEGRRVREEHTGRTWDANAIGERVAKQHIYDANLAMWNERREEANL